MRPSLPRVSFRKLAALNARMSQAFELAAAGLGLSCSGCPDTCCLSFFQHHTQLEWAFLRLGLAALPEPQRLAVVERAEAYLREARLVIGRGERPRLACPLLADGRCLLYEHRPMVCRLHGVPGVLVQPNGKRVEFSGCFRAQALIAEGRESPPLDRTPLLEELFRLEMEFLGSRARTRHKVDLPVAGMIALEPPR